MSEKHTPGPWTADAGGYKTWNFEGGYNGLITAANGDPIYTGPSSFRALRGKTKAEAIANAHLIAAAPELLEACEALLAAIEKHIPQPHSGIAADSPIARARAAIAKAKS